MKTITAKAGTKNPAKNNKKKLFFLGLGIMATGVLSYFGYNYWEKHKKQNVSNQPVAPEFKTEKQPGKTTQKSSGKNTQSKTKQAKQTVKQKANPSSDSKTQSSQTQEAPKQSAPINASDLAKQLYSATINRDFTKAFDLLKGIRSALDYSSVSNVYRAYFINGVRQTLVNGLLNSFTSEKQKSAFRKAFLAMGLKYKNNKWSLSGTEDKPLLITSQASKVWKTPKENVSVPAQMILGKEIAKRGNFTVFENEGKYFLIKSKHTTIYNQ